MIFLGVFFCKKKNFIFPDTRAMMAWPEKILVVHTIPARFRGYIFRTAKEGKKACRSQLGRLDCLGSATAP